MKSALVPALRIVIAALAWFGVIGFSVLAFNGNNDDGGGIRAVFGTLSTFTIQTNLLVAIWTTVVLVAPESKLGSWLQRPLVRGGVLIYITVTFTVFAALLDSLWDPEGITEFLSITTHYIVPMAFIVDWLITEEHGSYEWRMIPWWYTYPLAYLLYLLVRGSITGDYIYPFLDLNEIGAAGLAVAVVGLVAYGTVLSTIYIGLSRWFGRRGESFVRP